MSSSPPEAIVGYRDHDMFCGSWGSFFVNVWFGDVNEANTRALEETFATLLPQHPNGVALMVIVAPTASTPDRQMRARHAKLMEQYKDSIRAMAHIVEASGFKGSIIRTIIHTIFSLSRQHFSRQVFATIPPAAEWLAPQLAEPATPAQLLEVLAGFELGLQSL